MKQSHYEALKQLYKIKRLENTDKIESFDCGDDDLNDFILNQSSFFRNEKLAVSYVLKDKSNPHVIIAFFSLANDKISISDFDDKNRYNRFITVDAYSDAIPFYTKNGFIPLNEDDSHDKTRLLYFDLNDVSE